MQEVEKDLYQPNSWVNSIQPLDPEPDYATEYEWVWLNRQKIPTYVLRFSYLPVGCEWMNFGGVQIHAQLRARVIASIGKLYVEDLENISDDAGDLQSEYRIRFGVEPLVEEGDKSQIERALSRRKMLPPTDFEISWSRLEEMTHYDEEYLEGIDESP